MLVTQCGGDRFFFGFLESQAHFDVLVNREKGERHIFARPRCPQGTGTDIPGSGLSDWNGMRAVGGCLILTLSSLSFIRRFELCARREEERGGLGMQSAQRLLKAKLSRGGIPLGPSGKIRSSVVRTTGRHASDFRH